MNHESVSVIIPLYNARRYIGAAIQSVLAQTFAATEIIVVDDGSTDGGDAIVREYAQVRCVSQANGGIGAARNEGARLASSDYFAFLDADDLWEPNKLEVQMTAFRRAPELDMVFGHVQEFLSLDSDNTGQPGRRGLAQPVPGVIPSALLVRRDAFHRAGWFDTQWRQGEFASWYARAIESRLQRVILPDLVAWRRIHGENNGIVGRTWKNDYVRILKASLDRRRSASDNGPDTH